MDNGRVWDADGDGQMWRGMKEMVDMIRCGCGWSWSICGQGWCLQL